jgi:TRAP-type C4-dicarboxylate transport system permease small subunit
MKIKQESPDGGLGKISHFLNNIGLVVLFSLMILTVADIILRKIFNKGIFGTLEISEFMMVAIVFFSLAECELEDRFVTVDLLVKKLSSKSRVAIDAFLKFLGFILYCLTAFAVIIYAGLIRSGGDVSQDLLLPRYPIIYIVALALILFCAVILFRLVLALNEVRRLWIR